MVKVMRPVTRRRFSKGRKVMSRRPVLRAFQSSSTFTPYRGVTNPSNAMVFRGIGFPDKLTTNLVYSESFLLTPSSSFPMPYLSYKATSPYDPQNAIGGGQPTYYDQLGSIYNRYVVNGCKITAMFSTTSQASTNVGPYICGIQMAATASLPTTDPNKLLASDNVAFKLVGAQDGTTSVVQTYSATKNFPLDIQAQTQATTNTDPSINWYFNVFATPQGVTVNVPINCVIVMEFNISFSDLKGVYDS